MSPAPRWQLPAWPALVHGGAGATGALPHDFSTNRNAAGPLASVLEAVLQADRHHYPDPGYHALREQLGAWHGVPAARVVVVASASAFIQAFTRAAMVWRRVGRVVAPLPGYGNYAAEAGRLGLAVHGPAALPDAHTLCWHTEPASPTGSAGGAALAARLQAAVAADAVPVLDLAYQPLRLDGAGLPEGAAAVWQLWSPNKAAGLTGVRAAYAIAPPGQEAVAAWLQAEAPSWPVGADGVALLSAFATPAAQAELVACHALLRRWRDALLALLGDAGWQPVGGVSVTPFFTARPPGYWPARRAAAQGVQLRDATSLGLPGAWRLCALPPASQAVLADLLHDRQFNEEGPA